ncbi:GNAT family N-acetyltransferase [Chloroflexi bacterium TSY]|nr:GNAT family N-acetyltransferase [Chloroflexi bacterium TSY]
MNHPLIRYGKAQAIPEKSTWQIRDLFLWNGLTTMNESERAALRDILNRDPIWAAYGLADLQPEFDSYCSWYQTQTDAGNGVVLIFAGLEPPALLTIGPAAAIEQTLNLVNHPEQVYVSVQNEHFSLIEQIYDLGNNARPMLRMGLQNPEKIDAVSQGDVMSMTIRLTRDDEERIDQLLSHGGAFTPDGYDPYQLDNGTFFAINHPDGELVAMGGTHIVDWQQGIGAVGNMYTHPNVRGKGFGTAILQRVVKALLERNVTNIVLNVDQRNLGAQRIYKRLGFEVHCPFMEGIGRKICY